jgi:hypothetical protein
MWYDYLKLAANDKKQWPTIKKSFSLLIDSVKLAINNQEYQLAVNTVDLMCSKANCDMYF